VRLKLILLALPLLAPAELLIVEQHFGGIECASCATSVQSAFSRMRGVESAEVDMKGGIALLRLKRDNKIKLEAVRDRLKGVGFTPKEATVEGNATIAEDSGRMTVEWTPGTRHPIADKIVKPGRAYVAAVIPPSTSPTEPPPAHIKDARPQ
jgi:cation transport ATPase